MFWAVDSPSSLHEGNGSCGEMVASPGGKHPAVSRRLADQVAFGSKVCEGQDYDPLSSQGARDFDKCGQVPANPISTDTLFGDSSGLSEFSGFSVPKESIKLPPQSSRVINKEPVFGKAVDECPRDSGLSGEVRATGSTTHEALTVLSEGVLGSEVSGRGFCHSHYSRDQEGPKVVTVRRSFFSRGKSRGSEPRPSVVLRHLEQGVGDHPR